MDFGALPVLDGRSAPVPDPTALNLAWFERSTAEEASAPDRGLAEGGALLDRVREAEGLVYNGDGDYEN